MLQKIKIENDDLLIEKSGKVAVLRVTIISRCELNSELC